MEKYEKGRDEVAKKAAERITKVCSAGLLGLDRLEACSHCCSYCIRVVLTEFVELQVSVEKEALL